MNCAKLASEQAGYLLYEFIRISPNEWRSCLTVENITEYQFWTDIVDDDDQILKILNVFEREDLCRPEFDVKREAQDLLDQYRSRLFDIHVAKIESLIDDFCNA